MPINLVAAVGILSFQNEIIDFKPNLVKTLDFGIRSNMDTAMDVSLGLGGDLAAYAKISDDTVFLEPGEVKYITVTISFPSELEDVTPGDHQIRVSAVESPSGGGISARGAISTQIQVRVPYPGRYVRVNFDAQNVNVNEPVDFKITIRNLGTEELKNGRATIDIYDGFENKLDALSIENMDVKAQSSQDFHKILDTTSYKAGDYRAVATIYYFENKTIIEQPFKIGSLDVKIINYTKEFDKDSIGKFEIGIESKWNNKIGDIYADVVIKDPDGNKISTLKTPNTELDPWETKTIFTYWDTNGVEAREYDATITLHYSDKTTVESGKVSVIAKKKKGFEMPGFIGLNITTILILLVVLLIILDVLWLIKRKKKKKK